MSHSSLTAVYGNEAVEELEFTDNKTGKKHVVKDAEGGVFAAGDIRVKKVRQVATAVADGAIAGIQAAAMC